MVKKFLFLLLFLSVSNITQAQSAIEKIDDLLTRYSEYGLFNGAVIVANDGGVILEKAYGFANYQWDVPLTKDAKFRVGSVTKQFTAALILQLVSEGKIKLDGKITDYLPGYRKDTGGKVTIRELLNHTSGIKSYTNMPNVWRDSLRNHYTEVYMLKHFQMGDLEFTPGSNFNYNNTGYYLLAAIAEKVTGEKYSDLIKKRLLEPAGMLNSGIETDEFAIKKMCDGYIKQGLKYLKDPYIYMPNAMGAGNLYSTVGDLYKWDRALYGGKILKEKFKELMFTPNKFGYGFGWFVRNEVNPEGKKVKIVWHTGGINGFNSIIWRNITDSTLIVILSNVGPFAAFPLAVKIQQILYGNAPAMPKRPLYDYLYEKITDEGIDSAIRLFYRLKKEESDVFDFSESQLNTLGYILLNENRINDAIKIFDLNIKEFPSSSNVYDSMGEAMLKKGNKKQAIRYYRKSLELNPGNDNAVKVLKKLGVSLSKTGKRVPESILKKLAGVYNLFKNFNITVRKEGTRLFVRASGQPEFEVFPKTNYKYYYKVVNAQLEFVRDENGKIKGLYLYQAGKKLFAKKVK